jgi:DNA-binding transcriptional LysR family regulator
MDLNLIQAFVSVVDGGSFSAAARALGVPKSSVSRSVSRLEERLGTRLLERTTRRVNLTQAGRSYYQGAARGLAELVATERELGELQSEPRGLVRFTAPSDLDEAFLADVVLRFVREHPGISVETSLTNRVVDLLAEGFDVALRAGPLRDTSLVARKVGPAAAWLFAAPGYLKRRGAPSKPADLATHDCVLFRPREQRASWRLVGPRGVEAVEVSGSLHCDDFGFVRQLLVSGAGIGLLPIFSAHPELKAARLERVLPKYEVHGAPLSLVVPSVRHLPRRVALFRDFVLQHFGKGCDDVVGLDK